MQTFLPYASAWRTAKCLDNKRLGKQRVECKQILIALGIDIGQHRGNPESRWRNHPAVRMWSGHELCLAEYAEVMCIEWKRRGFKDSLAVQFQEAAQRLADACLFAGHAPNWLGYDRLHASHRSNLLRKDASWYRQFGWQEPSDLPYWWPVETEVAA